MTIPSPSIRAQCFTGTRNPHDVRSAQTSLLLLLHQVQAVHFSMAMGLLRNAVRQSCHSLHHYSAHSIGTGANPEVHCGWIKQRNGQCVQLKTL